jgi:hypothetical protein
MLLNSVKSPLNFVNRRYVPGVGGPWFQMTEALNALEIALFEARLALSTGYISSIQWIKLNSLVSDRLNHYPVDKIEV